MWWHARYLMSLFSEHESATRKSLNLLCSNDVTDIILAYLPTRKLIEWCLVYYKLLVDHINRRLFYQRSAWINLRYESRKIESRYDIIELKINETRIHPMSIPTFVFFALSIRLLPYELVLPNSFVEIVERWTADFVEGWNN
jgi:hypothetical protein